MDFFQIHTKESKGGVLEVFPNFIVGRSKDLMVRGRAFYAIWDEERGLWSRDEYDVPILVDRELLSFAAEQEKLGYKVTPKTLRSHNTQSWSRFKRFVTEMSDNSHQLDSRLTFANTEVKKSDYVSRRLPYSLAAGDIGAWDELVGTLYSDVEREKIEWAIGAIVSGDSVKLQKFVVLYGSAGTGKSTILKVIERLFEGYYSTFDAKALGSSGQSFSTEVFKSNPLVAIQHDGDLSRIDDNTRLNSIVSHEEMIVNEKYKSSYTSRINAFLFMGTNQPVRISDAKSGIIRRLIDVHPTGNWIDENHYIFLMSQIEYQLGAIAHHCLGVYQRLGKHYYNTYRPIEMMFQTDVSLNFVEAYYDVLKDLDGISLKHAYNMYKTYCAESGIDRPLPMYKFREELKFYFEEFHERKMIDGVHQRSYFSGFNAKPFKETKKTNGHTYSLVIDADLSHLDDKFADCPAQYAKDDGTPTTYWDKVTTKLRDLDTSKLHYVKVPESHVVIDFDLVDKNGEKSLERNLEAASAWVPTYAELSKSGRGVHLHYIYTGDVSQLARAFSEGIEIKVYTGNASLRRMLTKCNSLPIATISSGLPEKERKVIAENVMKSEKGLRDLIERNLRKEIHPGTKPSIDFIKKILDDAYKSGMTYDVEDLRPRLIAFANNSTNQSMACLKTVQQMQFRSEDKIAELVPTNDPREVFFDVEVYPNLFIVCWKFRGDPTVVRMINPSAQDIELLFPLKLIGYNNRRYDNHILYGRYMGYDNAALYELSQKIINGYSSAMFGEAYNLSYADIYDFTSLKQSLKKYGIQLGMHHMELDLPWDQPVPDDMVAKVVEYCVNDVLTTEATFEDRQGDWTARLILAELSELSPNDTTQRHTAKIIFGNDQHPQDTFVYTDLSREFPGYTFDLGKSTYRGEEVGEGGYVHAEEGMYSNVALLDIASMHPTTIEQLNLFGDLYTPVFSALKEARLAIKHGDYTTARKMFYGKLTPYLENEADADALAYALKIVINTVYGLTAAKFDNPFRDRRNIDNIVAKRGALFMVDLKKFLEAEGIPVIHIKTDSIKIPDATPEQIDMVKIFGEKYGYTFEHEATYSKLCLVNDAVYVAKKGNTWVAVGAQFQHPYVYKTLFTGEEPTFDDMCETKQVAQGVMYLDDIHVGRIGRFVPVTGGGHKLLRVKDDKSYAVTGTKDYEWVEAEIFQAFPGQYEINQTYFEKLVDDARNAIDYFGSFAEFVRS